MSDSWTKVSNISRSSGQTDDPLPRRRSANSIDSIREATLRRQLAKSVARIASTQMAKAPNYDTEEIKRYMAMCNGQNHDDRVIATQSHAYASYQIFSRGNEDHSRIETISSIFEAFARSIKSSHERSQSKKTEQSRC